MLNTLVSLDLSFCGQLQDLAPLAGLTSLQSLDLSSCGQLQDLSPLAGLTSLQSLDLGRCGQLQDLASLADLTSLQSLDLSYFGQLQDLAPLAGLTSLQSLNLRGCGSGAHSPSHQPALPRPTPLRAIARSGATRRSSPACNPSTLAIATYCRIWPLAGLPACNPSSPLCGQLHLAPFAGLTSLISQPKHWATAGSGATRRSQACNSSALATRIWHHFGLTSLQSICYTGWQLQDLSPLAVSPACNPSI
jgi:hypothetical protein